MLETVQESCIVNLSHSQVKETIQKLDLSFLYNLQSTSIRKISVVDLSAVSAWSDSSGLKTICVISVLSNIALGRAFKDTQTPRLSANRGV